MKWEFGERLVWQKLLPDFLFRRKADAILHRGITKTNVRLRVGSLVGAVPPCRHVFNMINDIAKIDQRGETVSKLKNL
ncbi:hypothetical protein Desti_1736 [Desulfomonile tiedjei DSM 6799]|uniref:Uncharacterized protein n=1 Tax=Desulfomonile tiedjei (strain ATCC 49306 / DSM 6799 / DCB-1) TaxID=706587 RepID=I4C4F5_DESTA|nr:hypothetical protein Desti_1736 [Desulfomonile tiedjei DSM 6799]